MTEIVRATFEEAGYDIKIELMPYARAVQAINEGDYEGIIVVGKKYAPKLVYPQTPTLRQRMLFMVQPPSDWQYSGYNSLLKVNLAMRVIKGFDYADDDINNYVSMKQDNLVHLHGPKSVRRGLELLALNRVDIYAEGELTALYNIAKYGYHNRFIAAGFSQRTFESYTGFSAHSPDANKYAQLLSDKISQLQQSGQLKVMLEKYGITTALTLGDKVGL